MSYEKVIYKKKGSIAFITLNDPDKLNVWQFKGGMTDEFLSALTEAEEDDGVKAVVVKGAGRAFSAGHDLSEVGTVYGYGNGKTDSRIPSQRIRLKLDRFHLVELKRRVLLSPKITIAQIHGYCVGEGLNLVLCCDLAVAAEDAQIGHTEQRLGFSGTSTTAAILIMTIGLKRALDMLLTGRLISGSEAERIGLVVRAVPFEKLGGEVEQLARTISLLPRDGIAIGKAMRHQIYDTLGLTASLTTGYIGHTLFTNIRWERDEYNFLKERRNKGVKAAFHGKDERFAGLI